MVLALLVAPVGSDLRAQEVADTADLLAPPAAQALPDTADDGRPSPGGAFLRAIALPGWGHASIGSYTRGGFYFLAQSATAWMMVRVRQRIAAAEDLRELREARVRAELAAEGVEDPVEIEEALDGDEGVSAARSLVSARDQQFEDWLALGIFLVFLSGADAFVSAHLADFPEPVRLDLRPVGERWEVGVSVPVGGGRAR